MTSFRLVCLPAVVLGLGVFWVSPAFAQDSTSAAASTTADASPKEMLKNATAAIEQMRGMVAQMEDLLKRVEERGDADAARCVRDKLAASRAVVDVAVLAQNNMQESLAQTRPALAAAEYRKIQALTGKVAQFLGEAQACAGDGTNPTGDVVREATSDAGSSEDLRGLTTDVDDLLQSPDKTPFE